jgi:F-type H+-transporting ATPase subunit epsilon
MPTNFCLEITTPSRCLFKGDVEELNVPGLYGELGILPDHAPLIAALAMGELVFKHDTIYDYAFIEYGFLEVYNNTAIILAEDAELGREIDYQKAFEEKERAEKELMKIRERDDKTIRNAEYKIKKELMKMKISERYK